MLVAYSWGMTTTENGQRDELAQDIAASLGGGNASVRAITNVAEALITKGYRKPRTITTVEELDALPNGSAILDGSGDVAQRLCAWWHFPETSPMGSAKVLKYSSTVTVIHEPGAEVGA